ncbi:MULTISPECIES: class I adenylate-forming enzyme family protein [unclassified Nocardiopsis]|uniref:class I adenylate-forming enzyme family protein n=1 Tax=Nocardiopsis TaxID=2013 RepID=UPI00387AE276
MPQPTDRPSLISGPPLETIADLIAGPRIDDMLTRAAGRAADRPAVRSAAGDTTFGELDAGATALAAGLQRTLGREGGTVALALFMDPVFPVAFFGLCRAGFVPALFNPMLPVARMVHVIGSSEATTAIVSPEVYRRLSEVADRLPALERIVLTHRPEDLGPLAGDVPTLEEIAASADPGDLVAPESAPDSVACLQFTSGTTGAPKGVRLTHRNVTTNAAQTASAHRLDDTSVVFNFLPAFHMMHLTIAITSMATLVVWADDDIAGSVEAADRFRATHYYTLPMRLNRLAADGRLTELEAPSLRAILSGGSALPPNTASVLGQHFGVPVVQGFGLQEAAPLTHFDDLDRPRSGSVGAPLAGTECRVVDGADGSVVPLGERGALQVRGPQLMAGYLGRDPSLDFEEDGWFATGDIVRLEEGGTMFVVDRLKDVFKRDNWLVSPTEIERLLLRHPKVADCVVFDHPDPVSGAVAHGLVVPRGDLDPDEIKKYVAERLPYYEHLENVEFTAEIPRSPQGKVQRREIRDHALARAEQN